MMNISDVIVDVIVGFTAGVIMGLTIGWFLLIGMKLMGYF